MERDGDGTSYIGARRTAVKRSRTSVLGAGLVAAVLGTMAPNAARAAETLSLAPGRTRVIADQFRPAQVSVGDPRVADADDLGNGVLVTAHEPGSTTITLIPEGTGAPREILVKVEGGGGGGGADCGAIRKLVSSLPGVTVAVAGGQCAIDGRVSSEAQLERIRKIAEQFPGVLLLVEIDPMILEVVRERLAADLAVDDVGVRRVGDKLILEGEAQGEADSRRIEALARSYTSQIVNLLRVNPIQRTVGPGRTVQIDVTFLAASTSALDSLGIHWSPAGNATVEANVDLTAPAKAERLLTGLVTNLLPSLQTANETGRLRVLERGALSTKSGQHAELFTGGEVGVPVPQGDGSTHVEFKEIGVRLGLDAVVLGDKVDLAIVGDVSALAQPAPGGVLSLSRSRIQTTQIATSGESVVIGGWLTRRTHLVNDRVPPGGGGALFSFLKSKELEDENSQLLIVITPTVLASPAQSLVDLDREIRARVDTIEADMR